jgi:predicted glycoside hydrolase/deacetylase ChbG (UPF0249 family)
MIICADDYGLSDDVNQAILDLVSKGAVSAVSNLVVLPTANRAALEPLLAHRDRIDLGLHFALVVPPECGLPRPFQALPACPTYGALVRASLLGNIKPEGVHKELAGQYQRFIELTGAPPDFIDGHMHVHQLPGARDGVIEFLQSLPERERPYVRNTHMGWRQIAAQGHAYRKSISISWFGGQFKRLAQQHRLATNAAFGGVYKFHHWPRYAGRLPDFVQHVNCRNGLLMTHPGLNDAWRRSEYEALNTATFPPGTIGRFEW